MLIEPEAEDYAFVSRDSFEVIEYLRRHGMVEVTYLLKRHGARWSANPKRRKHVAVMRKRTAALEASSERVLAHRNQASQLAEDP